MRKFVFIALFVAFLAQALGGLIVVASFHLNRNYISSELCINRFDAIPVCKGSCVLQKKLSETEQRQKDAPELKLQTTLLFYDNRTVAIERPCTLITPIQYSPSSDAALHAGALSSVFKPPVWIG